MSGPSNNVTIPAQGWKPRKYQLPLLKYMASDRPGLRAVVAWHRRAGKDLTSINIMAIKAFQRRGLYMYIGPYNNQIRRIIWQGQDGEGRRFIDFIPRQLVTRKSDQEMSLTLVNGSVIQLVGSDDPDKLVGPNPVGLVFSEYSLSDPVAWQLTNPILAENGGWALFNGTPRGRNHFFTILEKAKADKNWFASHLSVTDTKAIPPEELRRARAEMNNEARFQSEFLCSFNTPVEGSYYGSHISRLYAKKQMLSRIVPEPLLPVNTAWDIGMDDSTAIWFFQQHRDEIRVLNYYENSGEGLSHYVRELNRWLAVNDLSPGRHYFPHDVRVREMGTGKSRMETLRSLGVKVSAVKKLPKEDQIEAVRNVLPRCWFDTGSAHLGIEHLKSYRKEWDEKNQTFSKRPVHNNASHGADSFAVLAVGVRSERKETEEIRKERSQYRMKGPQW